MTIFYIYFLVCLPSTCFCWIFKWFYSLLYSRTDPWIASPSWFCIFNFALLALGVDCFWSFDDFFLFCNAHSCNSS